MPSGILWRHWSGSALVQAMQWCFVCCLTALSYYLNQRGRIISEPLCHSAECISIVMVYILENDTAPSSRDEWVHFCYMIYINGFRKRSCDLLSRLFEVASLTLCQSHDCVNTIEVILNAMCRIGRHQTTTTQLHAKRMRTFMCIILIAQVTRS